MCREEVFSLPSPGVMYRDDRIVGERRLDGVPSRLVNAEIVRRIEKHKVYGLISDVRRREVRLRLMAVVEIRILRREFSGERPRHFGDVVAVDRGGRRKSAQEVQSAVSLAESEFHDDSRLGYSHHCKQK